MGLVQSTFPPCPNCESKQDVTENRLFGPHNTARYYCEMCRTYFDPSDEA